MHKIKLSAKEKDERKQQQQKWNSSNCRTTFNTLNKLNAIVRHIVAKKNDKAELTCAYSVRFNIQHKRIHCVNASTHAHTWMICVTMCSDQMESNAWIKQTFVIYQNRKLWINIRIFTPFRLADSVTSRAQNQMGDICQRKNQSINYGLGEILAMRK